MISPVRVRGKGHEYVSRREKVDEARIFVPRFLVYLFSLNSIFLHTKNKATFRVCRSASNCARVLNLTHMS
jgi:hypothetical protein